MDQLSTPKTIIKLQKRLHKEIVNAIKIAINDKIDDEEYIGSNWPKQKINKFITDNGNKIKKIVNIMIDDEMSNNFINESIDCNDFKNLSEILKKTIDYGFNETLWAHIKLPKK